MQVHVSLPHVLTSAEHMCTPRAEHIRARVQGAREFATRADVSRAQLSGETPHTVVCINPNLVSKKKIVSIRV